MDEKNHMNDDRFPCPEPPEPREPEYLDFILAQMRMVAGREERDLELYQYLLDQAGAQQMAQQQMLITNRSVLRTNRAVTRRNLEIIEETYRTLTGDRLIADKEDFITPINYRSGLEHAVFNELTDAEIYRDMMLEVPMDMLYQTLMRLYTNTMFNIDRANFLYARASI
ncbi:MAG: hypothetical protein ACLFPF_06910 [Halanaerobiales bacterium]